MRSSFIFHLYHPIIQSHQTPDIRTEPVQSRFHIRSLLILYVPLRDPLPMVNRERYNVSIREEFSSLHVQ